jgi:hypothetical protein
MPKGGRHEPVDLLHQRTTLPSPNRRCRALEKPLRFGGGRLVSAPNRLPHARVPGAEEDAHALGRRERQVVRSDCDWRPALPQ